MNSIPPRPCAWRIRTLSVAAENDAENRADQDVARIVQTRRDAANPEQPCHATHQQPESLMLAAADSRHRQARSHVA